MDKDVTRRYQRARPRLNCEKTRIEAIVGAATKIFLCDGYQNATLFRIATEAGVSTRTIYQHYNNKGHLFAAAIGRLLEPISTVTTVWDLDDLDPTAALSIIANEPMTRARHPGFPALFRLVATEAIRFPELLARVLQSLEGSVQLILADYLRRQKYRGVIDIPDPEHAASLFLRMIVGAGQELWLFGGEDAFARFDVVGHVDYVIELFLLGALPRSDPRKISA